MIQLSPISWEHRNSTSDVPCVIWPSVMTWWWLHRQHVLNNIDQSLQHLGMDYVDLYIYHIWDYKTPAEEILEGMNEAVRQGKARYIGIANVYAYQLAKMNALAERNGWAKFISVQNHYNLIMREEEREMQPLRYGVEMTQISLAWLLTKVESPIVGATKLHHIEGAVKSLDVRLTAEDIRYLEEPYVPHNLSGVMAVNKPVMSEEPVWVAASRNK